MFGHNILIASSSHNLSHVPFLRRIHTHVVQTPQTEDCTLESLLKFLRLSFSNLSHIKYSGLQGSYWDDSSRLGSANHKLPVFYSDLFCLFVYSMPVENIYNFKKAFPRFFLSAPRLPLSCVSSVLPFFSCTERHTISLKADEGADSLRS